MRLTRTTSLALAVAVGLCATDALAQSTTDPLGGGGGSTATGTSNGWTLPPATPAAAKPMATVHIDSPQPANLEVHTDDGNWKVVCAAPCDAPVATTDEYRINGPSLRASSGFRLDPGARVSLAVEPSSGGGHAGGVALTVVGGVAELPLLGVTALVVGGEIAGFIFVCPFVAAFASKDQQSSAYGNCLGDIGKWAGQGYAQPYVWIPAVAGVALITTGIVLLAKNPRTGVAQTATAAALTLPRPLFGDTPPRFEAVRVPPAPVMQVLDLRF